MEDDTLNLIEGTGAGDTLTGTVAADLISGLAGDDLITGDGGDDFLFGGDGGDSIEGGEGDDDVLGQAGNDTLRGDLGDDSLLGLSGDDLLEGGAGGDFLEGGTGNDTILGGAEADTAVFGGNFADYTIAATNDIPTGDGETVAGLEIVDTRTEFPETLINGTDLVAGDVEFLEFADGGSVLDLAGFDPTAELQAPVLLAVAAADFVADPGEAESPFVSAIEVEIPADGSNPDSVTITSTELSVSGDPVEVTFALESVPTVGTLLLAGETLAAGDTFTQADINAGSLSYEISEPVPAGASSDGFEFSAVSGPFALTAFPVIRDGEGNVTAEAGADAVTGLFLPLAVSFNLAPEFDLDVDQNGEAEALTDGLNVLRVLLGAPTASIELGANTPDSIGQEAVVTAIESGRDAGILDVDQNGEVDALTDGLNVLRVLLGAPTASIELGANTPDSIDQQAVFGAIEALF